MKRELNVWREMAFWLQDILPMAYLHNGQGYRWTWTHTLKKKKLWMHKARVTFAH